MSENEPDIDSEDLNQSKLCSDDEISSDFDENNQSKKRKRDDANSIDGSVKEDADTAKEHADNALKVGMVDEVDSCPYNWVSYYDSSTGKPYYYNLISKKTQWDQPPGFTAPDPINSGSQLPRYSEATSSSNSEMQFKATFNRRTGAFSTSSEATYWETKGRANDRESRQMSAFFDLNDLDENRRKAAEIKNKLAHSNIDWRKYQEEKKAKKAARMKEWLLKED